MRNRLSRRTGRANGNAVIAAAARSHATSRTTAIGHPGKEPGDVDCELVRRNRELTVLNAIAVSVSGSLDLTTILDSALSQLLDLLEVKAGWVYLKNQRTGQVALAVCKGLLASSPQTDMAGLPDSCACCACRQALNCGEPKFVHVGPVCLQGELPASMREGLKCHVSVPLVANDEVLGVMNLACVEDRLFPQSEIQLLSSIGRQVGMAVENARLYRELSGKEATAQHLLDKLISAHEDERARIARELHDDTGQRLTALLLGLASLEATLPPDATEARQNLEQLQSLTASVVEEVRRLMRDLRPSLLDDLGLIPAVSSFAKSQLKPSGIKFAVNVRGIRRKLAPSVETALFRIFQEAITNVARHSRAKTSRIELHFQETLLDGRITDDGRGFDPITSQMGWRIFGLLGMEERVKILGGALRIESHKNQGSQICVRIPIPPLQTP